MLELKNLTPSGGQTIYYLEPSLTNGSLPAVIYFALSAKSSLLQDPFNQPVLKWLSAGFRVFSWDLPFHNEDANPQEAIEKWSPEVNNPSDLVENFTKISCQNIDYLLQNSIIDEKTIGIAGLSRGGFMAAQIAAKVPYLQHLIAFAPLTDLGTLTKMSQSFSLTEVADNLTAKKLMFFIGNLDQRVSTKLCTDFILTVCEKAKAQKIRSPQINLRIYPSIGFKGHGTPPEIFDSGASWLINQIQNG